MRTDVDACDCTQGLYGYRETESQHWRVTLGEKFLGAPRTRTRFCIVPSFAVGRCTQIGYPAAYYQHVHQVVLALENVTSVCVSWNRAVTADPTFDARLPMVLFVA